MCKNTKTKQPRIPVNRSMQPSFFHPFKFTNIETLTSKHPRSWHEADKIILKNDIEESNSPTNFSNLLDYLKFPAALPPIPQN